MTSQEKLIRIFTALQDPRFILSRFLTRKEERKWIYDVIPDDQPRLCSCCHREGIKQDQQWIELKDLPIMVTVKDVARMFRLDYDLVYRIDFKVLEAIVKVYESLKPKDEIKDAQAFLVQWVTEAWKTKLKPLQDFAMYIKRHQQMLLNVICTGKTSSVSEGINTKISAIKAICYGFHKVSYFCMKIWQRCGILNSEQAGTALAIQPCKL